MDSSTIDRSAMAARQAAGSGPRPCVFIHTNDKQRLGAVVSAHSMRRQSRWPETFEVRLIEHRDHPFLARREGQLYRRDGQRQRWINDDLQSFTPLRFMPPELMGYRGRALVIDPDVFAIGDVVELLGRDMDGKAILCRTHAGLKRLARGRYASSVMLLDCAKLRHWHTEEQFDELFSFRRDYRRWIGVEDEDPETIGELDPAWNDFDHLRAATRMLHTTRRMTQPWKTGLPVDFLPVERFRPFPPFGWLMRARRALFGDHALLGRYRPHPDPRQEALFFGLLRECLERGVVSETVLREAIEHRYLRPDALAVMERAPDVDEILSFPRHGAPRGSGSRLRRHPSLLGRPTPWAKSSSRCSCRAGNDTPPTIHVDGMRMVRDGRQRSRASPQGG